MDGLTRTDRMMMNYMQMSGAGRMAIFMKLELPHSLPQVFSGIKIAATYSVMGAIIAEWIGASEGIGYYMLLQNRPIARTSFLPPSASLSRSVY